MNFEDIANAIWARLNEVAITPLAQFFSGLDPSGRTVLYVLLAAAAVVGFVVGRRWTHGIGGRHAPGIQNSGEARVSRILLWNFRAPDYHLMNRVTLRMADGTTEIDHILVSRFGVFVIETKDYSGWLFASAESAKWTQVWFTARFRFQNPIHQNRRHVRAVCGLLDFLPPDAVKSVVVFTGDAEFKTDIPEGVIRIAQLVEYLKSQTEVVMSANRLQFCVGRLETERLAISEKTDVEHMRSLARRHGVR